MKFDTDNIKWPEPWAPISNQEEEQSVGLAKARAEIFNIAGGQDIRDSIAEELKREVSQNHPLAGHTCTAIAYNKDDPNEFIFITSNPDMPIAYVHLTWETETDPMYPYTVGYKSLEEFVKKATEKDYEKPYRRVFINRKEIIILSYVGIIFLKFIYSVFKKGFQNSIIYLFVLIIYSTLVFFTFRGNKIATWIMIISILLTGVGGFLIGALLIPIDQIAMKVIFILLGIYFVQGGIKLLSGERMRGL